MGFDAASGNELSTPRAAKISTAVSPALARTSTYLPRSKPASGTGRSETQRDTCSPPEVSAETRLPVATSVQPAGWRNSRSKSVMAGPTLGYQIPRAPTYISPLPASDNTEPL